MNKIRVMAFVGPSGTGKSYRAQMVAGENNINYIIDDGLLIKAITLILFIFFLLPKKQSLILYIKDCFLAN